MNITLQPANLNTWQAVQLPELSLTNGQTYSAVWSTQNSSTGTLGVEVAEQSGSSWSVVLSQGPSSGINSITVSGSALSTGVYRIQVYTSLSTPHTLAITTNGQLWQCVWVMVSGVLQPANSVGVMSGGNLTAINAAGVFTSGNLQRNF